MKPKYDRDAVDRYWSRRLKSRSGSKDQELEAVLTYNAPAVLNRAYDRWERQSLLSLLKPSLSGCHALDIGCGIGRISLTLASLGAQVTAVDLSRGMINRLKKLTGRKRLSHRLKYLHASSDLIPLGDSSFEIITCFGLLEHLPPDVRRKSMIEAFRLLKKSGRFYLVVNNSDSIFLSGRYGVRPAKREGHYLAVVGIDWLQAVCKRHYMSLNVKASNPMYALVHYGLFELNHVRRDRNLNRLCELATKMDLEGKIDSGLVRKMSSHFMVEIRHK